MTAAHIVSKLGGRMDGSGDDQQKVLDALRHLGTWPERADKAPLLTDAERSGIGIHAIEQGRAPGEEHGLGTSNLIRGARGEAIGQISA
jgi:hypothetical protein